MPISFRRLLHTLAPALGLVVVWCLFAVLVPDGRFTTLGNQKLILLQTAVVAAAAIGATLILAAKGLDLAVGSTVALGTMLIAWLLTKGWPAPLASMVGGPVLGLAIGTLTGSLISGRLIPRLPLSPFIVTLAMLAILRGLAQGLGGERPLYPPPGAAGFLPHLMASVPPPASMPSPLVWLPPGVWLVLLLAAAMALLLRRTVLGRRALAVGDNDRAARYAGVPVERTTILVYALGVSCAGVAAVLQFSFLTIGDPGTAQGLELQVIAACVIGGASLSGGSASVTGSLLGALLMTTVANGCTKLGLANWIQLLITGAIILAAVALDQYRRRARG